jgi:membrane peptidoglycan carboxypeptidase
MKTHLFLGTEMLPKLTQTLGIKTQIKNIASSALGTSEINILDYSNAYITLANEGKHENPHLIEKITDKNGNIIYEYKYKNEYILNNDSVFILNNLLTSTYDYDMVNYTSPTLISISNELDSKYSVKSGSTKSDYWTIGYNNDYLIMIWAGNDDNSDTLSKDSKITKKIWAKTITNIKTNNKGWYEIPKNITISTIDPLSGKIKENGIPCYFIKGSEPNFESLEFFDKIAN